MTLAKTYDQFLQNKTQLGGMIGFTPSNLPSYLFDFQTSLVDWSIRKGRAAIFADCGLGKTPMQLVWADIVSRKTNKPVLILTPLAVSSQTIKEAKKFGIEASRSKEGKLTSITVTNYERLHYFNPNDVSGVVCDESSILKSFDGVRRAQITEFMRRVPYRLLCTATASPNDFIELGTSSEALGELGYIDMLGRFFINDNHSISTHRMRGTEPGWRLKGHANEPFWRWVCSWARACRKPSDLGFDDNGFILPPLTIIETIVKPSKPRKDMLFDIPAVGLKEEREIKRRTISDRCEIVANKISGTNHPIVIWCQLNDEADYLTKIIPDSQQVSGSDSDDTKEKTFEAFQSGQLRILVIKPKIGAFGLNWQHCSHIIYFASHSYEQYYQAIRRCWRFGQTNPVLVELIRTTAEDRLMANLQRKSKQADDMFNDLVKYMKLALNIKTFQIDNTGVEIPQWL